MDSKGNFIHPTAIIHPNAVIGCNNYIGPYVVIGAGVQIRDHNRIEGHSSIGSPAEHHKYFESSGYPVVIGSHNTIREFTTINAPTDGVTQMGDGCIMLRGSHLSHDSTLENFVTVSCNVLIGGHSYVMEGANLGLGSIVHQFQTIGAYAMLGMGTVVPKKTDIEPGSIYAGNPAKYLKKNEVGIARAEQSPEQMTAHYWRFRKLRDVK